MSNALRLARPLLLSLCVAGVGCEPSDPIVRLAERLDGVRTVEARGSGLRVHQPCIVDPLSGGGRCQAAVGVLAGRGDWVDLLDQVEDRVGPDGPAAGLRALGSFDALAAGDRAALDRAVSRLRIAVNLAPGDPDARNDLAVVLLQRAQTTNRSWDAIEALEQLDGALEADSAHAAARFNRALALNRLGLVNMALDAWLSVGEEDPELGWREEALDRSRSLARASAVATNEAPTVDALFRNIAGILGASGGLPEGTAEWDPVRRDALLLSERGEESALALIDALATPDADKGGLVAGLASYVEALDLWGAGAFAQSQQAYRRVLELVDGSSRAARFLRWRATIGAARQSVYESDFEGAEAGVSGVLREAQGQPVRETRGHAHWALGLSIGRRGDANAAGEHLAASDSLFLALGQRNAFGAIRVMRAELLSAAGSTDDAMNEMMAALPLFGAEGGNMHQNLLSVAGRLVATRHSRAAVWFHREGLRLSESQENPQFQVEALVRLAQSEARAGDSLRARRYLDEAIVGLDSVRDSIMQRRVQAEYDELVGMHLPGLSWASRDSLLTEAIDYFSEAGNAVKVPSLLERRGAHRIANDRVEEGRADLLGVMRTVEEQLGAMVDPGLRASLIRARAAAIDALVSSHLALGDTLAALVALDGPRAKASRRISAGDSPPLAEALDSMSPESAVLAYGMVDDRAVVWIARKDGLSMRSLPLGASELAGRIERLRFALGTGAASEVVAPLTARLWSALIGPIEPLLEGIGSVTLVTDGPLNGLPFAVLGEKPGDLLQAYRLLHAPSVAFALERRAEGEAEILALGGILAVSASEWDPQQYPGLPSLTFAEEEALEVAGLYGTTPVARPDADRLARDLTHARTFHFAGHGLYRSDRQDLSTLVLPGAAGGLTAARIATLDLTRLELAVLAACSTQEGSSDADGGLSGLTWSFLDAGARGVIGSLWSIPDQETSHLMVDLHRRLSGGETAVDALRAAQLEAVRTSDIGWTWAAFRYEGHPAH